MKDLGATENALILVTEAHYGSGDFFAGLKWLKSKNFLDQLTAWGCSKVVWIVSSLKTRQDIVDNISKHKNSLPHVSIIQTFQWQGLESCSLPENAKAIILFPSVHEIPFNSFERLKNLNLPILHINGNDETVQMHLLFDKHSVARAHGGFSGLGLFMESKLDIQLETDIKSQHVEELFSQEDTTTFFSYLNKSKNDVVNHSTIQNFIKTALQLANQKHSINIITNTHNMPRLAEELKSVFYENKFSTIELVSLNNDKLVTNEIQCKPYTAHRRVIRLVNIFPLSVNQMLFSMANSHAFIQVTGSESLSEIFSICRLIAPKFPFYQMMYWAKHFYDGWIKTASLILGDKSDYVQLLKLAGNHEVFEVEKFVTCWQKDPGAVLKASEKFCNEIYPHQNRYTNMLSFIDSYLELCKEFGHSKLITLSRFIEQLVVKFQNVKEVVNVASSLFAKNILDQNPQIFSDFANLLRYSRFSLSGNELIKLFDQFKEVSPERRLSVAYGVRDVLSALPVNSQDKWLLTILPLLAQAPKNIFNILIQTLITEGATDTIKTSNEEWVQNTIKNLSEMNFKIEDTFLHDQSALMLTSSILPDGIGDLIKVISVYKLLQEKFPNLTIYFGLQHYKINLPDIIEVLRINSIPVANCKFFAMGDYISSSDLEEVGLIINLATSFFAMKHARKKGEIPYIEISENHFASFYEYDKLPVDSNHEIVCMGIGEEEVGLDVIPYFEETPKEAYSQLDDTLKEKMINSIGNVANIKNDLNIFNKHVFFVPLYMKHDHGTLSIKYAVLGANKLASEKKSIVLWQSQLTYDLNNIKLQKWLNHNKISKVTVYSKDIKSEYVINNSHAKSLTIITGRIDKTSYDRLHIIAKVNSRLAGAVGQNSLEATVKYQLLPAFYVKNFLIPLLLEFDALASRLFGTNTIEYVNIHYYFSRLIEISEMWDKLDSILDNPVLAPWINEINNYSPESFFQDLEKLVNNKNLANGISFFNYKHPDILVENIFENCDFNVLQDAWTKMCIYIQNHHNVSNWIVNKVKTILPVQHKAGNSYVNSLELPYTIKNKYVVEKITQENLPFLFKYLKELVNTHCLQYYQGEIDFYLTNASSMLIDTISGFPRPSIIIQRDWLLKFKKNDLVFFLSYLAIKIKGNPVEIDMRSNVCSAQQIVEAINDEKILAKGLAYIHRLNKHLGDAANGLISEIFSETNYGCEYCYLTGTKTFITDLYKAIEIKLASLTKNKINENDEITQENHLDSVIEELKQFSFPLRRNISIANPNSAWQLLESLEKELPAYSARNIKEYTLLTNDGFQFLNKLRTLPRYLIDKKITNKLKNMLARAFDLKVSFFDSLYIVVCGLIKNNDVLVNYNFSDNMKQQKDLLFLSPFDQLYSKFQILFNTLDFEKALNVLKEIQAWYDENENLFCSSYTSIDRKIIKSYHEKNFSVKVSPHISKLGALLPWEDFYLEWNNSEVMRSRFKNWIQSLTNDHPMPSILYSLGFFDDFIINKLSSKNLLVKDGVSIFNLDKYNLSIPFVINNLLNHLFRNENVVAFINNRIKLFNLDSHELNNSFDAIVNNLFSQRFMDKEVINSLITEIFNIYQIKKSNNLNQAPVKTLILNLISNVSTSKWIGEFLRLFNLKYEDLWDSSHLFLEFLNDFLLDETTKFILNEVNDIFSNFDNLNLEKVRLKVILARFKIKDIHSTTLTLNSIQSTEDIENFVAENITELSMPEKCPEYANFLSQIIYRIHSSKILDDKTEAFIRSFLFDPYYPFGLSELRKFREKIACPARLNPAFPADTDYLELLLNLSSDMPLFTVLKTIDELFAMSKPLSLDFWKKRFGIKKISLTNGINIATEILNVMNELFKIKLTHIWFLVYSIQAVLVQTTRCMPYKLFTDDFYDYFERCLAISLVTEVPEFTCILFENNEHTFLTDINDFDFDKKLTFDINKLLFIYQKFDNCLAFPSIQTRDAFGKIVKHYLENATDEDKILGAEFLLLSPTKIALTKIPLTDYQFSLWLINYWSTYKALDMGVDDGSDAYWSYAVRICSEVILRAPGLYRKLMLEKLLDKILAQKPLSVFVGKHLEPKLYSKDHESDKIDMDEVSSLSALQLGSNWNIKNEDALIKLAAEFSGNGLQQHFVDFITEELSKESLIKFLDQVDQKVNFNNYYQSIFGNQLGCTNSMTKKILVIMLFYQFWERSLEERAVIVNTLLLPAQEVLVKQNCYEEVFDFIIDKIIPKQDSDAQIALAFLKSYLNTANEFTRPFLLTAIISANQRTKKNGNLAELLPKLAEAMGAVTVKIAQAAESSGLLPDIYNENLQHLKNDSRIPNRWTLWEMISNNLPHELKQKIKNLGRVLGGASLYIAVEVIFEDDSKMVFRLLRDGAKDEINYGIKHLNATIEDCEDATAVKYKSDLVQIIKDAEVSCHLEIDRHASLKQYKLSENIYNCSETINVNGHTFKVTTSPVKLHNIGDKYQVIDYADGLEFNTLKKDKNNELACAVIAYVIVKNQLQLMLSGKPFDADLHGAQTKSVLKNADPRSNQIQTIHFDFGEVCAATSPVQLDHCSKFFKILATEMSSQGLANFDMSKAIQMLNQYIRNHAHEKNDLHRLRRIRKGILSLNDYIVVLKKEPYLVRKLSNVLFTSYIFTNYVRAPLKFFSISAKESTPVESLSACPYDNAYSILEAINKDNLKTKWVISRKGKDITDTAEAINKLFNATLRLTKGNKDSIMWENCLQSTLNKLSAKIESLDFKLFNAKGTDISSMEKYKYWKEMILDYLNFANSFSSKV